MQTYLLLSVWLQFWSAWTIFFLILAAFVLPKAAKHEIHKWRIKSDYRYYLKEETYWRALRKASVYPRQQRDWQRIQGMTQDDFDLFLVSIWRDSPFWYDWRLNNYWLNRQNKKFEVLNDMSHSPTGETMEKVIYF